MPRLALLLALAASAASAQSVATYRVTFEGTWSAATHPDGFPAGAHFSPIVGATHRASAALWAPGAAASPGIEAMAERGRTLEMVGEVDALVAAGHAERAVVGPGLAVSPGTVAFQVEVREAFPLVTLVTMLAPSPDWFVGVHGLDLHAGGAWAASVTVPLQAYDAGTDSGTSYTAPDADTQPRGVVAVLDGAPFAVGGGVPPVGAFRFERVVPAAGEGGPGAFGLSRPVPNPVRGAASLTLTLDRPQAVSVHVVDAVGRTVAVLAEGARPAGPLALRFDAGGLPAGVYAVVARGEDAVSTQRVVVTGR